MLSGNSRHGLTGVDLTGEGSYTSSWGADGQLKCIGKGASVCVTYDALGREVKVNNNGKPTELVYCLVGDRIATFNGQKMVSARWPCRWAARRFMGPVAASRDASAVDPLGRDASVAGCVTNQVTPVIP